jgi:hypothetical protein
MTPAMASMVPGGCVEVDASLCSSAPASAQGSGTPVPGSTTAAGHWSDGPTEITVLVYEPNELKPYPSGAPVIISVYKNAATVVLSEVARGVTDSSGRFVWKGSAPSPNKDYKFRVRVEAPGNVRTTDVAARHMASSGQPSRSGVTVVACPPGTDSLICAVAQAQLDWKAIYDSQIVAWGNSPQAQSFAADQAHANVPLNHPTLRADWSVFSWWVGDMGIPPKDWPALVANRNQAMAVFKAIPFPRWPGIEDLFERCAGSIPIGQGKVAELYSVHSPRLYSRTWSDYFPRTSKQINTDMAAAYMPGLKPIILCMERKILQKIKETQRTMRTMSILSYATVMINLPMLVGAGAGGFAAIATETYDFIQITSGREPLGFGVSAGIALAATAAGDIDLVVSALEPIINSLIEDMDPTAAAAVKSIFPQVVRLAFESVGSLAAASANAGSNTIVSGGSSFIDMSSIASAISVMVVKAVAAIPKMYAADRIEALQDSMAGFSAATDDFISFLSMKEVSPEFKPFLVWVVEAMGLADLWDSVIDQLLEQFQDALESGESQGGGVTVVQEEDGGGPSFTPTDSEGNPTDVNGTPLPGGEAPITPPSGGGTAPGDPPPEMPPMPTTTTSQGVGGVGGANPLNVAGAGGVVALLLAGAAVLS